MKDEILERIADALEAANFRRVTMLDRVGDLISLLENVEERLYSIAERVGVDRPPKPTVSSPLQDIGDSLAMAAQAQREAERYGACRFPSSSGHDALVAKEAFQAGAAWQRGRGCE